jgi:hypothetical protein
VVAACVAVAAQQLQDGLLLGYIDVDDHVRIWVQEANDAGRAQRQTVTKKTIIKTESIILAEKSTK